MFSVSNPEHYIPILLFLLVAIGFGAVSITVGRLIRPKNPYKEKDSPYECGVPPINDARERISVRYYVIAMLFLVFDVESIFLIPFGVAFLELPLGAVLAMLVFVLLLFEGLVWAWMKGVLNWK